MSNLITRFTISDTIDDTSADARDPWFRRTSRAVIVSDDALVFSFMRNRNQFVLPGGGIEPEETPQECAIRECQEELGLVITSDTVQAIVREYYNGILRFENLYVRGTFNGERTPLQHTQEEDDLGIAELWLPLTQVQPTLLGNSAHLMVHEHQVEHVQRAIANCHMRELLGIAAILGWDYEPIIASRTTIKGISVSVETLQ